MGLEEGGCSGDTHRSTSTARGVIVGLGQGSGDGAGILQNGRNLCGVGKNLEQGQQQIHGGIGRVGHDEQGQHGVETARVLSHFCPPDDGAIQCFRVLVQAPLLRELCLVNQDIIVHLLAADAADTESVNGRRPRTIKAQPILLHIALENCDRVVAQHEQPLLVGVLLVGVNGLLQKGLHIRLLVFGKTLGVRQDSQDTLALAGGGLCAKLGKRGRLGGQGWGLE